MTVRVIPPPPRDCASDGHLVALRVKWDLDDIRITPFCEVCRLVFLPSSGMSGSMGEFLMKQVESCKWIPEAPPEAYEGMFA